ncbi:hypothetical protein SAMN04488700_1141 [Carnobacterium iners]|uniref:PAC domain-containing protein n=1 Tax=Carnobacterium iners TaxID=1073423 RepID=A0A1X7N190_9LACT|nr:DUF438 domain-containing protein [Carnobacterium iners]SEK19950.1 hypothetical protein SAMN04488114_101128 [Carnobacterium iners]SMH30130.1 hypothetical protein SAMN04488700_1141 [Carnobacterium iners]
MENTTVYRQKKIVEILTLLHEGGAFEEAKKLFDESFDGVDVSEITSAERELIASGLDPSEIQHLCNVHAAVFKGSIRDIHQSNYEHEQPGHPVHTLKLENKVIQSLLEDEIRWTFEQVAKGNDSQKERLKNALKDLSQINKHYARKETLIFSYMERYGISAPPKVMWGVDDAIRAAIKDVINYIDDEKAAINPLRDKIDHIIDEVEEMIFKEEEIMVPMVLDVFRLKDWQKIAEDSFDIGFSYIANPLPWKPSIEALAVESEQEEGKKAAAKKAAAMTDAIAEDPPIDQSEQYDWQDGALSEGEIVLPTGVLKLKELSGIFGVLPVDLTFVDKDDRVRFYSEGKDRAFPRTNSIIGREVINCHPPKSMHMVQKILDGFRSGEREEAEFWINMANRVIYIRYFAIRDKETKDYLGCLEVTQDITKIQKINGECRLLDDNF